MLFHKILSGYAETAKSLGKILLLFLFCVLVGLCLVYPLWKFAVCFPELYTIFVSAVFLLGFAVFLILQAKKYLSVRGADAAEKKRRIGILLAGGAKTLVAVCGVLLSGFLLYSVGRLAALIALVLALLLYGILSFGSKKT